MFFYLLKQLKYVFKGNNIKMIGLILDFNFVIIIISYFEKITLYRNFCIASGRRTLSDVFKKISFCDDLGFIKKNLFYLLDV
jgi:hypothetical protein